MTARLSQKQKDYLNKARFAVLGTVNSEGQAHLVPIVFATVKNAIYFAIDAKQKKSTAGLRRIQNIKRTGKATLLANDYRENWSKLSHLILYCGAVVLEDPDSLTERATALEALKEKYSQYRGRNYLPDKEKAIFVKLTPQRAIFWQNLHPSVP